MTTIPIIVTKKIFFIPIGQGDPDYDDSETESDNSDSDDSENQDDLFSSFQSNEFQTYTAYWVPPNGYKGQVVQLLISTSMSMDRCVICAREKIEPSRLMLTWTNLWELVEFGSLNLLGTADQRFVCNDQCIEDFKVTDFGRQCDIPSFYSRYRKYKIVILTKKIGRGAKYSFGCTCNTGLRSTPCAHGVLLIYLYANYFRDNGF